MTSEPGAAQAHCMAPSVIRAARLLPKKPISFGNPSRRLVGGSDGGAQKRRDARFATRCLRLSPKAARSGTANTTLHPGTTESGRSQSHSGATIRISFVDLMLQ